MYSTLLVVSKLDNELSASPLHTLIGMFMLIGVLLVIAMFAFLILRYIIIFINKLLIF
jgi:hypothetical protein